MTAEEIWISWPVWLLRTGVVSNLAGYAGDVFPRFLTFLTFFKFLSERLLICGLLDGHHMAFTLD